MNDQIYFFISGFIFGCVTLLHFLRLINHWVIVLGPWSVPLWLSWFGLVIAGGLSVWAFRLARRI